MKNKNVVVATDDTHRSEKQDGIKNVVVASDETRNNEKVADKEAGIKNVVVASDDAHKNEQDAEKETGIKNVAVASKETCIDKDDHEDEKETGTDLGISLDKLSLGPKRNSLCFLLVGLWFIEPIVAVQTPFRRKAALILLAEIL